MKGSNPQRLILVPTAFAGLFGFLLAAFTQTPPAQKGILVAGPAQESVVINKRPLRDLGHEARSRIESRSIDLDSPFSVELTGVLEKSGKLDPATIKYTKAEGGKEIVDLVKKAIEAINDSGYLTYLSQMRPEGPILIRAAQDAKDFDSSISFEVLNESRARSLATGYRLILDGARQNATTKIGMDKNELLLVNSSTISSENKTVVIKIGMPKPAFREMIEGRLAGIKTAPQS